MDENDWINPREYKPSDDEWYITKDRDRNLSLARYEVEARVWRSADWRIVEVVKYCRVPIDEDD